MLRPATPLTVLLAAAFLLLLVSVLSTPIIKQIPLATFDGVNFGVFGFCQGDRCSPFEIGYDTASLFNADQTASFNLPNPTRTTLSAILIIHPVAALFTLVMMILAASAHFHAPSHSPRYLLGIFILSILTLLLALLSFLIDVLLFVPHMAWGSYLVLAATILIAASGIVSCAMRRTLVSRKARKRRIEENAEMNGENFYNRQAATAPPVAASSTLVNGAQGSDSLPAFATFEEPKKEVNRTSDERMPLTTRTPTDNSRNAAGGPLGMNDNYRGPMGIGSPPRDQYGNPMPLPQPGAYGGRSRDPSAERVVNRQYSGDSVNSRGRGMPPGGPRGRGGYPSGARGNGYGARGGYGPPRGGYGPPRGGYGPPAGPYRGGPANDSMSPVAAGALGGMAVGAAMRGGRPGPPPSYGQGQGRGYDRGPSPAGSYGPYGRRPLPQESSEYGRDGSAVSSIAGGYATYNSSGPHDSLPRAESPPPLSAYELEGPVGQAIEMNAKTGSPSRTPSGYDQYGVRNSDGDVAGMVGLQQQRNMMTRSEIMSDGSKYSAEDAYVPPRAGWTEAGRSSPLRQASQPSNVANTGAPKNHKRTSSGDNYYEDVDPRFADPQQIPAPLQINHPPPGAYSNNNLQPHGLDGNTYDDFPSGSRSPAESERSNFTSVSQRGVNPRWNQAQAGYGPPMPTRRPVNGPQQRDMVLNSNPDFELPGGRGARSGSAQGRMPGQTTGSVPNSAYPG